MSRKPVYNKIGVRWIENARNVKKGYQVHQIMARSFNYSGTFTKTRKKRPESTNKNKHSRSKGSKNYVKPYRGQGR